MVIGWDIGGVNTKAALVSSGAVLAVRARAYELQRAPGRLAGVLRAMAEEIGIDPDSAFACAVTMTAELSQMFRTKRDGVAFVLDAVEAAFPEAAIQVFASHGGFVTPSVARHAPLEVAAANWAATARLVASHHPDALLVDTGTTTTDIIPIVAGRESAEGRSDPGRLVSGELVYTGVVRTPAEAIAPTVPLEGHLAGVSAEGFALAGDVHLWRGDLDPADYTWPTPDGRPATREFAGERLARVVCADRELIDEEGITAIADALAAAQIDRLASAMRQVLARHPAIRAAVVTGVGAFLAARAARAAGLDVVQLAAGLGDPAARCAPAACVALLVEGERDLRSLGGLRGHPSIVDVVIKLGGGVLAHVEHLGATLDAIAARARDRRVLIVPGGGPFADAVREVDRRHALSPEASHWMAILGMDQYAHVIASRVQGAAIAETVDDIARALASGHVPVLAPSRWLRVVDPLPHSWDVTSDSIAAWVAGQVGARDLMLIKPPGAHGDSLVDGYFARALSANVSVTIVTADEIQLTGGG
jgi:hypothetical protein